MSYENPRAVIDTQSAQGLQQLQNTIAGTFAGVVKSYKADKDAVTKKLEKRELENRKRREEFQKQEDTLYENTSKTTARYGIEQAPELNALIDEYSDLKNANNSGTLTSEEVSINKQKIAAQKAIPARTLGLYEGITESALSLKENKNKDGDYGGLDIYGDPKTYEDLSTWIGTSPGSRKLSLKPLDNGIDLEIYAVINGRKYSSTQIERLRGKDSELLTRVPDPRPEFSDLTTASFMTVDPNTGKKSFKKGVLGKERIDYDTDEDGDVYKVVTNLTNEKQLKATGRIEAKASIEALSPRARAALWNNKLAPRDSRGKLIEGKKDDPVKLYSTEEASSPDFIEKLEEAWVNEWFKTNIGSEVEISRVKVKVEENPQNTGLTSADDIVEALYSKEGNGLFSLMKYNDKEVKNVILPNENENIISIQTAGGNEKHLINGKSINKLDAEGNTIPKTLTTNFNLDKKEEIKAFVAALVKGKGYRQSAKQQEALTMNLLNKLKERKRLKKESSNKKVEGKGPLNEDFYNQSFLPTAEGDQIFKTKK
tara:strand:- start:1535 stop:3157 length:1623 start_codon:yes stop_codon:yes gene_type:complete